MKTKKTMDVNKMGFTPLTQDELVKFNGGIGHVGGAVLAGVAGFAYGSAVNYIGWGACFSIGVGIIGGAGLGIRTYNLLR